MMKLKKIRQALLCAGLGVSSVSTTYAACSYGSYSSMVEPINQMLLSQYQATISAGLEGGNIQVSLQKTNFNIVSRITALEQTILAKMTASDGSFVTNMRGMTEKIVDQIKRTSASMRQANTARAAYKEKEKKRQLINEAYLKAEQPITTCLSLSAGQSFPATAKTIRYSTANASKQTGASVVNKGSNSIAEEYSKNKQLFGTNSQLENGDVQASVIFGSINGGGTRPNGIQNDALRAVIGYLTGSAFIPAVIEKNPSTAASQNFNLMQRRNAAVTSLTDYVITSIAEKHTPRKDMAEFFKNAKLTMTPEQQQNGVSMADAMELYVKKLMSKEQIASLASSNSELPLLRSLAQNDGISLWMEVQELNALEAEEMMDAARLSLLTEKVLGQKAKVYRQDTVNHTGF